MKRAVSFYFVLSWMCFSSSVFATADWNCQGITRSQMILCGTGDIDGDGVLTNKYKCKAAGICQFDYIIYKDSPGSVFNFSPPLNPGLDNCPQVSNSNQLDSDGDSVGDACDSDSSDADGDGVNDVADNCPAVSNSNQLNTDGDAQGNICDSDDDNDAVLDTTDNCLLVSNASQIDADGDGVGDACDATPNGADADGDGITDASDNCPAVANVNQVDTDGDGIGDVCDVPPADATVNWSESTPFGARNYSMSCSIVSILECEYRVTGFLPDYATGFSAYSGSAVRFQDAYGTKVCVRMATHETYCWNITKDHEFLLLNLIWAQADADGDVLIDTYDADDDNDGVLDVSDNCPLISNLDQLDSDSDTQGNVCDAMPNDTDNDGVDNNADAALTMATTVMA